MKRPSPATVIALLALIVALGGTATAAKNAIESDDVKNNSLRGVDVKNGTLGSPGVKNNSLRSVDIKNGTLGSPDVKNNSLRGVDIKNRSIGPRDLAPSALANAIAGATGPQGPQGGPGPQGPTGLAGSAAAYARIDANGNLDPARSANMTQANVQKGTFTGSYCVRNLPFTPRNAVATAESGGANLDLIVTTKVEPPNISVSGCNDPQVAISVWDASLDNGRNAAFSVWIED